MEVSLPDCQICKSPYYRDIEKMYRGKHKILPIAKEFSPKFGRPVPTMRDWLTKHFENLHRKYRVAQEEQEKKIENILESENINFDDYKREVLKRGMLHLEAGVVKVKPTDIAALENTELAKKKLGLDEKVLKLRMASIYGGFLKEDAVEGEVVDGSKGILPEGKN